MEGSQKVTTRRFVSVVALARRAWQTFHRFPLVVLSAVAAALVLHHLAAIEFEETRGAAPLYPLLMTFILGIPLFLALGLLVESRGWSRMVRMALAVAGLLTLLAYYMLLPFPVKGADLFRYFQLVACLHLLMSFVPFIGRADEENGFWQYNKVLLLRFAMAALYSFVLFVGLSLAIAACEALLDFDFDEMVYLQLWYWVVFVYNTWFFLAGVPEDTRRLNEVHDYPVGLRVFTQYVLIPLVAVYLVILYAYMGKIIVEWDLPKGWVGYPVIGVSVTGMLALLLVHPIRDKTENAWIAVYAKYFHWSLFPLIALISVAIITRIKEYGITENRYAVAIATVWLLGIALYFSFKRRRDIRIIPLTLCLGIFVTAFGPWSATAISRNSQLGRLRETLVAQNVMVEGGLERTRKALEFDDEKQISNIVGYLHDFHGIDRIRDWYAQPERVPPEASTRLAVEEMGLKYIRRRDVRPEGFEINGTPPNPVPVAGFDHLYELSENWEDEPSRFGVRLDSVSQLSLDGTLLRLGPPGGQAGDLLSFDLAPLLERLQAESAGGDLPEPDRPVLDVENERHRMLMYLAWATGTGAADSLKLTRLRAKFLIDVK